MLFMVALVFLFSCTRKPPIPTVPLASPTGVVVGASSTAVEYKYLEYLYNPTIGSQLNNSVFRGPVFQAYRDKIQALLNATMTFPIQTNADPSKIPSIPWYNSIPADFSNFIKQGGYSLADGIAAYFKSPSGQQFIDNLLGKVQSVINTTLVIADGMVRDIINDGWDKVKPVAYGALACLGVMAGGSVALAIAAFSNPVTAIGGTILSGLSLAATCVTYALINSKLDKILEKLDQIQETLNKVVAKLDEINSKIDTVLKLQGILTYNIARTGVEAAKTFFKSITNLILVNRNSPSDIATFVRNQILGLGSSDYSTHLNTAAESAFNSQATAHQLTDFNLIKWKKVKVQNVLIRRSLFQRWYGTQVLKVEEIDTFELPDPQFFANINFEDVHLLREMSMKRLEILSYSCTGNDLLIKRRIFALEDLKIVERIRADYDTTFDRIKEKVKQLCSNKTNEWINWTTFWFFNIPSLWSGIVQVQVEDANRGIQDKAQTNPISRYSDSPQQPPLFTGPVNTLFGSYVVQGQNSPNMYDNIKAILEESIYNYLINCNPDFSDYFSTLGALLGRWENELKTHIMAGEGL